MVIQSLVWGLLQEISNVLFWIHCDCVLKQNIWDVLYKTLYETWMTRNTGLYIIKKCLILLLVYFWTAVDDGIVKFYKSYKLVINGKIIWLQQIWPVWHRVLSSDHSNFILLLITLFSSFLNWTSTVHFQPVLKSWWSAIENRFWG